MKKNFIIFSGTCLLLFFTKVSCLEPTFGQVLGIYGGPGAEWGMKICNAPNGGFLLFGTTESFGNGRFDYPDALAIRVDSQGKILWQKDFGGIGSEYPYRVIATRDNGYILAIASYSFFTSICEWLIKIDDNGNIIWQKAIGPHVYAEVMTEEMTDGSLILAGMLWGLSWCGDPWIAKIDNEGNIVWERTIWHSSYGEPSTAILGLDDMGALLGTCTALYRFDKDGNVLWSKPLRDASNENVGVTVYDIINAQNGAFIVLNFRKEENDSRLRPELMKISADGDIIWTKVYHSDSDDQLFLKGIQLIPFSEGMYYFFGYGGFGDSYGPLLLSFDENGKVNIGDLRLYGAYGRLDAGDPKSATLAKDGNIAFCGTYWVGDWKDKNEQIILIKTGEGNKISGNCVTTLFWDKPLNFEDSIIIGKDEPYKLIEETTQCIDTSSFNFITVSNGTGINTFCPIIYSVKKLQNPFRLEIIGDNFILWRNGYDQYFDITINDVPVPETSWKSVNRLIAKKGNALKSMLPKGATVCLRIKGKTDPYVSFLYLYESDCFYFTR